MKVFLSKAAGFLVELVVVFVVLFVAIGVAVGSVDVLYLTDYATGAGVSWARYALVLTFPVWVIYRTVSEWHAERYVKRADHVQQMEHLRWTLRDRDEDGR